MSQNINSRQEQYSDQLCHEKINYSIINASDLLAWQQGHYSMVIACPYEDIKEFRYREMVSHIEKFMRQGVKVMLIIILPQNFEVPVVENLLNKEWIKTLKCNITFELDRSVCNLLDLDMLGETLLYRETFLLNCRGVITCQVSNALSDWHELELVMRQFKHIQVHERMLASARSMLRKWLDDEQPAAVSKRDQSSSNNSSNASLTLIHSTS